MKTLLNIWPLFWSLTLTVEAANSINSCQYFARITSINLKQSYDRLSANDIHVNLNWKTQKFKIPNSKIGKDFDTADSQVIPLRTSRDGKQFYFHIEVQEESWVLVRKGDLRMYVYEYEPVMSSTKISYLPNDPVLQWEETDHPHYHYKASRRILNSDIDMTVDYYKSCSKETAKRHQKKKAQEQQKLQKEVAKFSLMLKQIASPIIKSKCALQPGSVKEPLTIEEVADASFKPYSKERQKFIDKLYGQFSAVDNYRMKQYIKEWFYRQDQHGKSGSFQPHLAETFPAYVEWRFKKAGASVSQMIKQLSGKKVDSGSGPSMRAATAGVVDCSFGAVLARLQTKNPAFKAEWIKIYLNPVTRSAGVAAKRRALFEVVKLAQRRCKGQ